MRSVRVAVVVIGSTLLACVSAPAVAGALPANFNDSIVLRAERPTSIAFAPDGRIFVGEQSGLIKIFDGPGDTTATTFADLRTQVYGRWDRGLESITLDPRFPQRPYVYASYTYDALIGGTAPKWGVPGQSADDCPTPPGATADGCVVSGRLSRLTVSGSGAGNAMSSEKVLINDWCQQFPSHSLGDLGFGADGNLYMSAGDGASFGTTDWGQFGIPLNPCGDPPTGVGGTQVAATGEGGALRSQDIRSSGDPLGLDGTLIRVDPDTGRPVPDVAEGASTSQVNTARVVAYGLRNPFRFAVRPGTNPPEIWVGDVGWNTWEEIDRVETQSGVAGTTSNNFGWPCVEGPSDRPYAAAGFCKSLYAAGGPDGAPYYSFRHGQTVDPTETSLSPRPCTVNNGSAISGVEFYDDGTGESGFPAAYDGSLFFGDYARGCIWVMKPSSNGLPDPAKISVFQGTDGPVDLEAAPDGSLWYVGISDGEIHRISYESSNHAPVARASATPDHGAAPLQVRLDASSSTDVDAGDTLNYAWDLDGDGQFDDSNLVSLARTFSPEGVYRPRVRVTDQEGASATTQVTIDVGAPPVPVIESPDGRQFDANEPFDFNGSATDAEDGPIPRSGLSWSAVIHHCVPEGGCHEHAIQTYEAVAGGHMEMPGHGRPYYLTLTLTAEDSDGLAASTFIDIYPTLNVPPVARLTATPDHGRAPLDVELDASGSSDANTHDRLDYTWDLDGDGSFDDGTGARQTQTYEAEGDYSPTVTVTDPEGASSIATVDVDVGAAENLLPVPGIDMPIGNSEFSAGEEIAFSGGAVDPEDGELPGTALSWRLLGPGCPDGGCDVGDGTASATFTAPNRVDPYELRLRLTATDSEGGSASTEVVLAPRVARLTVKSGRAGARVSIAGAKGKVPFTASVMQGADVRVATPLTQHVKGIGSKARLEWRQWSDGGDRVHAVVPIADATLRSHYRMVRSGSGRGR